MSLAGGIIHIWFKCCQQMKSLRIFSTCFSTVKISSLKYPDWNNLVITRSHQALCINYTGQDWKFHTNNLGNLPDKCNTVVNLGTFMSANMLSNKWQRQSSKQILYFENWTACLIKEQQLISLTHWHLKQFLSNISW